MGGVFDSTVELALITVATMFAVNTTVSLYIAKLSTINIHSITLEPQWFLKH